MTTEVTPVGGWPIDEPLPLLLTSAQLRRVFNDISDRTFRRWEKRGAFKPFEAKGVVGVTRYSGPLLRKYAAGEFTFARSFGRGKK